LNFENVFEGQRWVEFLGEYPDLKKMGTREFREHG